ncbi:MAG TPA: uroporphyrinogen decarboxylase family protein [Anaerolineaceae bacterium]|nr:uroporphyrinogen decarboxylase family protein [Anaerolineaceae bacterium]
MFNETHTPPTAEKIWSGKDLLLRALRHEAVPSVPWVPYAGVHAGKLKGYTATEVLRNSRKLVDALLAVNEVYDPDGQPVVFDLQLEAEILGCELYWTDNTPPSVATHPLAGVAEIPQHVPAVDEGRLPIVLEAMRQMKAAVGDRTGLYGLVTGPLTLASHLRGTEIFMNMMRQPDYVQRLIRYAADTARQIATYYIDAGMDVIGLVDPLVSQISPRHFDLYLAEAYSELFAHIRRQAACSSFFVCGDGTKNLAVMCQTGPDSLAVDENIDMLAAKPITDAHNVTLCGNIPLTTKMLLGSQQDNMKFVVDFLDSIDHHNLILSPGCDMPYDTPVENVVGCMQAVRHVEETRQLLQNYQTPAIDLDAVAIPNYKGLDKPLVEVFTLDSASCAACAYMLRAAVDAAAELPGEVRVVEYKFTKPENVARVLKMGVKNLPSLYINGELKFSSLIPAQQVLIDEIKKYIEN